MEKRLFGKLVNRWVSLLLAALFLTAAIVIAQPAAAATAAYRLPFEQTASSKTSQGFASYYGTMGGYHNAQDWTGMSGGKVFAVADGEIVRVTESTTRGAGVYIKHGDFWSEYMHLFFPKDVKKPKAGDRVTVGQQLGVIATIANTPSFIFGSHLHWGIRVKWSPNSAYSNWYSGSNSNYYYTKESTLTELGFVNPTDFIAKKLSSVVAEDLYTLKNGGGKFLNAGSDKDGGNVDTAAAANSAAQKFTLVKDGSFYRLIASSSSSKRVLNAYTSTRGIIGTNITLYKSTGDLTQAWLFEKKGDGYIIHPANNPGVALTVESNGNVDLAANSEAQSQLWYLGTQGKTPVVTPTPSPSPSPSPSPTPEPPKQTLSDWTPASQAPSGAKVAERKWVYDAVTTTQSKEASLAGWTQTGGGWTQTGSGSVEYANFPSGYYTGDSTYSSYNKTPFTAYDNGTSRRTVTNSRTGYIYWHWSRPSPTDSTGNRLIEEYRTGTYSKFYAFIDAGEYGHTDRNGASDGSVYYIDKGKGTVSWWWFRTDLMKSTYTDETQVYNYEKTERKESSSVVTPSASAKNIQELVRYYK